MREGRPVFSFFEEAVKGAAAGDGEIGTPREFQRFAVGGRRGGMCGAMRECLLVAGGHGHHLLGLFGRKILEDQNLPSIENRQRGTRVICFSVNEKI